MILFIFQAAHQPPAHAGNLRGVQGKALLLGHFDGDGLKIAQKSGAAQRATAQPQPAHHLCFVAHADLAQLDARAENGSQILDQHAEIHALVGCKIEQNLGIVERVLAADQLHLQLMLGDFFLADGQRFLFLGLIFKVMLRVLRRSDTNDLFKRRGNQFVAHLAHAGNHLAVFHAAHGFYNHRVAGGGPKGAGIKIIKLACVPETNADYTCHV